MNRQKEKSPAAGAESPLAGDARVEAGEASSLPAPGSDEPILRLIAALVARLADLHSRLPAHSIPPAMLAELDDLDEQLAQARARLKAQPGGPGEPERL